MAESGEERLFCFVVLNQPWMHFCFLILLLLDTGPAECCDGGLWGLALSEYTCDLVSERIRYRNQLE